MTKWTDGYDVMVFECNDKTEINITAPSGQFFVKTAAEWLKLADEHEDRKKRG